MRNYSNWILFLGINFITLVFSTENIVAQDIRFTQFYASPLTLNPAMTGLMDGKFRVGAIYRDQWRSVLDKPYKTFSAAFDIKFELPTKGRNKDFAAAGLVFFTDKVTGVDFTTNQIALSGGYHKSLNQDNSQYLSLGVQAALSQRGINYESIYFGDQFNGIDSYTRPTNEEFPENNFGFSDYAVGLNYSISPRKKTNFSIGGAIHHFLRPEFSFYERSDDDNTSTVPSNRLLIKYSTQMSAQIPLGSQISLIPRVLFSAQGPHTELNIGTNLKFELSPTSSTRLQLGTWVRPTLNGGESFNLDAIVLLAGIEFQSMLIGLSYDANLNSFSANQRTQGAFEMSISYMGEYDSETILCPTF